MKLTGTACGFFETGCEGMMWVIALDGKQGYEALYLLNPGDLLTIYNEDGSVVFQGKIEPDRKVGYQPYPGNPQNGQPCALGFWIHWTQKGWKPDAWAALFLRQEFGQKPLRAEVERKYFDGKLSLAFELEKPPTYVLVLYDFDQKQQEVLHIPIESGDELYISDWDDDAMLFTNNGKPIFGGVIDERPWAVKNGWDEKHWQSLFDGKRRGTLIKK